MLMHDLVTHARTYTKHTQGYKTKGTHSETLAHLNALAGQPPAVFAAAVPNNMKRQLADLVTEVHREDAAMRQQTAMLDKNGE